MTQQHPTPAQFAAIRALDDARLWQFMVLLEDFGWRVGLAWVAMCNGWNEPPRRKPIPRRLLQ